MYFKVVLWVAILYWRLLIQRVMISSFDIWTNTTPCWTQGGIVVDDLLFFWTTNAGAAGRGRWGGPRCRGVIGGSWSPGRGGSSLQLSGGGRCWRLGLFRRWRRWSRDLWACRGRGPLKVLEHRSEVNHRPRHCKHDRTRSHKRQVFAALSSGSAHGVCWPIRIRFRISGRHFLFLVITWSNENRMISILLFFWGHSVQEWHLSAVYCSRDLAPFLWKVRKRLAVIDIFVCPRPRFFCRSCFVVVLLALQH